MDENMNENEVQDDIELTGEDNAVEPELEEIEGNSNAKVKKLRDKLKECEAEKMEHLENLQRVKAEFLNSKKRLEEERLKDKERAVNDQIEKLLPLCDSFHMAMANKEAWDAVDAQWRSGIEGIHAQLHSILSSYNVSEVSPLGEEFDPQQHEAMGNAPVTEETENGKVVQVIQNGFVRTTPQGDVLLRPARVIVGEISNE
tara:strand:+ start:1965 stop:2567 length:603 start_codon:yes stop_codon:yes gene_type:complete